MTAYRPKLNNVLQLMEEKKLSGLIIYSNGRPSILCPSYFHYFAEVRPMGANNCVIISRSGSAVAIIAPPWDTSRVMEQTWIENVQGSSNFIQDVTDCLKRLKIDGTAGLVGASWMPWHIYAGIQKEIKLEMADDIIEKVASMKTCREIELARKAANIADVGFEAFLKYARVGVKEYELAAEVEFSMRVAGAEDNFFLLSSEKHNQAMHAPYEKKLEAGDVLLAEISPCVEGQFVQLCRTIVLGEPSPLIVEKYDILMKALRASFAEIKSGASASLLSVAMNRVISDAGYKEYCYPPYMRARGHGLGVGSIAPGGDIDDHTKTNFETNQVIIVHPNQYLPETGYLACGETVLVTDSGIERLARTETKLYVSKE